MNLNELTLEDHDHPSDPPRRRDSAASRDGRVTAYFDGLEDRLVEKIRGADMVVGCVAWLTNERILDALSRTSVSLVVQKEDFLRPDLTRRGNWAARLRQRYDCLHCCLERLEMPGMVSAYSYARVVTPLDPVRCVGNHNKDREPAFPRAHHKFVVFGRHNPAWLDWEARHAGWREAGAAFGEADGEFDQYGRYCGAEPACPEGPAVDFYGVWTGSFNFTENASCSLENAVYVEEPAIVRAYYDEYAYVLGLSEPLDWTAEWCEPEWRVGT